MHTSTPVNARGHGTETIAHLAISIAWSHALHSESDSAFSSYCLEPSFRYVNENVCYSSKGVDVEVKSKSINQPMVGVDREKGSLLSDRFSFDPLRSGRSSSDRLPR